MNRKKLSTFIIIPLLIIGTFYYFISSDEKKDMIIEKEEIDLNLKILISYSLTPTWELPVVGDLIWFDLKGDVPEDIEYIWNLGDGSIEIGKPVTNTYIHSNHYNVSVKCSFKGKIYSNNTTLSVTNQDTGVMFNSTMKDVSIWSTNGRGTGCGCGVTPGITIPIVDVALTVDYVVGTINISVWIENHDGNSDNDIMIDSMSETYRNEVVKYEKTFLPSTFEGVEMPYYVAVHRNLVQGVSGDYRGHIFIDY